MTTPHTAYPATSVVLGKLYSTGLTSADRTDLNQLLDVAGAINASVDAFELRTGYRPFLAARDVNSALTATTRAFDPPVKGGRLGIPMTTTAYGVGGVQRGGGTILDLGAGLLSGTGPLAITVAQVAAIGASTPTRTYVANADYLLRPSMASDNAAPWTWIQFMIPVIGQAGTVQVTGQWGYATTLPDSAYDAIACGAALLCYQELRTLTEPERTERTFIGPLREQFSTSPLERMALPAIWQKRYDDAIARYTRPTAY